MVIYMPWCNSLTRIGGWRGGNPGYNGTDLVWYGHNRTCLVNCRRDYGHVPRLSFRVFFSARLSPFGPAASVAVSLQAERDITRGHYQTHRSHMHERGP